MTTPPRSTLLSSPVPRVILLLLLVIATPLLAWRWGDAEGVGVAVDPADDEWDAGRPRQAALLLDEMLRGRGDTTPEDLLRLSRAHAGWGNHEAAKRLLQGRPWLDRVGDGEGWRVLAATLEAEEEWGGAAEAWERALSAISPEEVPGVALRRIRALIRAGAGGAALGGLEALPAGARAPGVTEWVALELAREAAARGDTTSLHRALPLLEGADTRSRALFLPAEARLAAGDTLGALPLLRALGADADLPASGRADALSRVGELTLASGDTATALPPLRTALSLADQGSGAYRAARILLELQALGGGEWLRAATALEAGVDPRRAVEAWERILGGEAGLEIPPGELPGHRLRLARLLLRIDRGEEARPLLEGLLTERDRRVALPALELLVGVARAGGEEARVRELEERIIARYPESGAALSVVFFRADAAHDRDEVPQALALYREAAGISPSQDLAGLARMRWGHLLLREGDPRGAAVVFEDYLERFPTGRRWSEAAYWAARSREALGEEAAAARHRGRILEEDPLGYYALRLGVLDAEGAGFPGEESVGEGPPGSDGEGGRAWIPELARTLELLHGSRFDEGAAAVRGEMEERAAGDPKALLAVAEALHAAGLHLEGVNLGYEARRAGAPWDLRLARVVYPFPHREMILREARDRGVDPWLVAAIIRQESAFVPGIESGAGAVGFMQLLPRTGAELAAGVGITPWSPSLLRVPEMNVHLGTAYLEQLLERHGPDLALVLSAYNAGPTRAARWRELPEANDHERFIERIPFGETRQYVKNVLRNAALYQWLYAGR